MSWSGALAGDSLGSLRLAVRGPIPAARQPGSRVRPTTAKRAQAEPVGAGGAPTPTESVELKSTGRVNPEHVELVAEEGTPFLRERVHRWGVDPP